MATSGYKDFNVNSTGTIKIRYKWTAGTPNIANNFTPVNWTLQLISTTSGSNIISSANKAYSVVTDGTTSSGTNAVGINGGATKTLASGSKNIYHNADGTKTFNFSFSQEIGITYAGAAIGTITGSGTGTLDTIPRASVLGTIANFTIGDSITIPITKYSSSFSDSINIYIGNLWIKTAGSITNNKTITFTEQEISNIYAATAGSTSAVFRFVNTTYSGSTAIGTSTKTATGAIGANIKPTISSVTMGEAVADIKTQFGFYVQNKSKIGFSINATAGNGSSIEAYETTINGAKYTTKTFTTEVLRTSGTNTYTVKVTDKRGRTATTSGTFTVTAYIVPQIATLGVQRCLEDGTINDNGGYAKVNATASITSLSSKNTKSFSLQYKKKSDYDWTTVQTYTSSYAYAVTNKIVPDIDPDEPYEFRILAVDYFEKDITKLVSLSTGYTILDIKADGKGIAFGGVSSKEGYQFFGKMYDRFNSSIQNGVALYESGMTDANTTIEELILSNTNTPTTDLWYVTTIFNSEKTAVASRTQIAHPYDKQLAMYTRYYVVGKGWSKWTATDIVSFTHADNNGHVHFANGLLIQWGKFTFTPSAANTVVSAIISFPIVYDETPRVGADPHSAEPNTIECSVGNGSSNYNALRSMTVYLRKTNTAATPFQWMAIGYKKPTEGVV